MAQTLRIYYTSDMHGYFLPTDFLSRAQKDIGLARLAPLFEKDGDTLVIDGGDTIQGAPLMSWLARGGRTDLAAQAMNAAGYDYVTPGNHDFNYGMETLTSYLDALEARCLCANVTGMRPYAIHVLENGLRVGLIGAVTEYVPVWEKPENLSGVQVSGALDAMRRYALLLRPQVDILIGIYHGGFEKDLETGRLLSGSAENLACAICEQTPLDILLTGHQHIPKAGAVYSGVHVAQTPANAQAAVFLEAEMGPEGPRVASRLLYPGKRSAPGVTAPFADIEDSVQDWLDSPAGRLPRDLLPGTKLDMARHGSPIADFFNQVQLWATGAQLSCASLANSIKGFSKDASIRDVMATYVYPNTLAVLRVTGAVLRQALERCAAYFERDEQGGLLVSPAFLEPKTEHYNYDFFMGFSYAFDTSLPPGSRVTLMRREGRDIQPGDSFTLCMNNYRASGSGGYEFFASCPRLREDPDEVSDLILKYLETHPDFDLMKGDFRVE